MICALWYYFPMLTSLRVWFFFSSFFFSYFVHLFDLCHFILCNDTFSQPFVFWIIRLLCTTCCFSVCSQQKKKKNSKRRSNCVRVCYGIMYAIYWREFEKQIKTRAQNDGWMLLLYFRSYPILSIVHCLSMQSISFVSRYFFPFDFTNCIFRICQINNEQWNE